MLFGMRFDFRNPAFAGTTCADRYGAALEMAEWGERLGCVSISVSEHHGSSDGYLPSPVPFMGALAARTASAHLTIAALIAPFYEPLKLAEDLLVLDHLSRGRVGVIVGGGYVPDEFAMFDVPLKERPRRVEEVVRVLRAAFAGEPFEYHGRTVHLTPGPFREGGISILLGGSSAGAARRAARIADGFVPTDDTSWQHYRDEVQRLGRPDPGANFMSPARTIALAADVEQGWAEMGPYFLHETNAYGEWAERSGVPTPYTRQASVDHLRAGDKYAILTPAQYVAELQALPFAFPMLHPMCGGIPPELAWQSLRLFEQEVLPAMA